MEAQGSLLGSLLPLVALFAIFYFLIIRPQQKQAKDHKAMLEALQKGDKIVTNGGAIVEVTKVEEDTLTVKHVDGSENRMVNTFVTKKWDN